MATTFYNLADGITWLEQSSYPNNPGALMNGNSPATYNSWEDGYNALLNQLSKAISGNSSYYDPSMSLQDFVNTYTGTPTGASNNYAPSLANTLGVDTDTPISALSDQNLGLPATPSSAAQNVPSGTAQNVPSGTAQTPTSSSAKTNGSSSGGVSGFLANYVNQFGSHVADGAAIVLGLVLVAGAVFTFRAVGGAAINIVKTQAKNTTKRRAVGSAAINIAKKGALSA